jgi:hypothetical protein
MAESNRCIRPLVQSWLLDLLSSASRPNRSAWSFRIRGHGDFEDFPAIPGCWPGDFDEELTNVDPADVRPGQPSAARSIIAAR